MRNTGPTIPDIIAAAGGPTAIAKRIKKGASTVSEWKRNHSIPIDRWPLVIAMAVAHGFSFTNDDLVEAHIRAIRARRRA